MKVSGRKNLVILGSTGSIGRQTLDVVRSLKDGFKIIGLAAGRNLKLLAEQIAEFKPEYVSYTDNGKRLRAAETTCKLISLDEMAALPEANIVIIATSGKSGLTPTISALKAGKTVALANKEALVMAGEIMMKEVRKGKGKILPVDSEHSALWQCLRGEGKPSRLILIASGGPFRGYTLKQLETVTVAEALKHPSWRMGKKITIDSATLMNKGLEVIEAHYLFDMPFDKISVLVHPESIIHSMAEFPDGVIKAQMSYPDMRLPIQYALTYPERPRNSELPKLDLSKVRTLTFEPPDTEAFPCLNLAIEAGKKGGTYPAVLCGADEVAVELFLKGKIKFLDIPRLVEKALASHEVNLKPTLQEILEADGWARDKIIEYAEAIRPC